MNIEGKTADDGMLVSKPMADALHNLCAGVLATKDPMFAAKLLTSAVTSPCFRESEIVAILSVERDKGVFILTVRERWVGFIRYFGETLSKALGLLPAGWSENEPKVRGENDEVH